MQIKAEEGLEVSIPHLNKGKLTVQPACDTKDQGQWYCVTHQEGFQNNMQQWSHCEAGKHVLVWICFRHGPEVP